MVAGFLAKIEITCQVFSIKNHTGTDYHEIPGSYLKIN